MTKRDAQRDEAKMHAISPISLRFSLRFPLSGSLCAQCDAAGSAGSAMLAIYLARSIGVFSISDTISFVPEKLVHRKTLSGF